MSEPHQQWTCDVCGGMILNKDDGIVVWRRRGNQVFNFKIVHRVRCDRGKEFSHENLSDFLGADGLALLTSYATLGPVLLSQGDEEENEIGDMRSFIELIRRLHIPHYEEARRYFHSHEVRYAYADGGEVAPYRQEGLEKVIRLGRSST